jgi:signal transduction histidine kinase
MSAMPAAPPRARWPWVVLALALAIALIGFALVPINGESVLGNTTNFIAFMGMGVVGALSLSRSPTNRVGFLLLWIAITIGTAFAAGEASTYLEARGDETAASWLAWPGNTFWVLGLVPLLVWLPLVFPDGRVPTVRWRVVAWAGAVVGVVAFVAGGFAEPRFTVGEGGPPEITITNPLHVPALEAFTGVGGLLWPFLAGLFVLAAVSAILRFRRSSGVERQQLKWFAFAGGLMAAYLLISIALEVMRIDTGSIDQIISGVVYLGIPTAVGIAILQYRLWDLDVVVKKTVVAGTLVVFALVVYGAAVALIPTLVDMDNPVFLFALALALGLAFRPAIGVARRLADRLVYGKRATPYEVLTEFSERMGDAYATEDVLPRMAQVLGQGTGAEVARVWLLSGRELRQSAAWPAESVMLDPVALADEDGWAPPGETAVVVRDRGDVLGALSVQMPAADPMNPTKEKLVRDLAAQAGPVLRNVRLVEDLRASRQRLVAAQDEERRRLERDIHDGAQQQLVALAVKARLAQQLVDRDPARAVEVLGQIEAETQDALGDLRDLARGIYPPLLSDEGLAAAIRAQARKGSIEVALEAEEVGRYPEDVEATVYFCALEALQNVAKYADAGRATVRLVQSNGSLTFAVIDEGRGFDPASVRSGTGLQGMADRLAAVGGSLDVTSEVGGGTTITGRVPLPVA